MRFNKENDMFERIDYIVKRLDGDYAYLVLKEEPLGDEKCVARALLPVSICEGSNLKYEMMEYELI